MSNWSGPLITSTSNGITTWAYANTGAPVVNGAETEATQNREADMEETIAELEEEMEELRAQVLEARLLIGRIMRGDQPTDEELEPHLEAVAEEFE